MSLKVVARNFIKIRETKKRFNLQNLTILVRKTLLKLFAFFINSKIRKFKKLPPAAGLFLWYARKFLRIDCFTNLNLEFFVGNTPVKR